MSNKVWKKAIDNEIARHKLKKMQREKQLEYLASLGRRPPDNIA